MAILEKILSPDDKDVLTARKNYTNLLEKIAQDAAVEKMQSEAQSMEKNPPAADKTNK